MAKIKAALPRGTPIEVWFQDEARIGQKNKITRRWARRGTRPSAPKDQRTKSAYIFGAICPELGKGAGLIRKEIEARHDEADQLRLRAVERAQIDADLAQRRFMLVDPNNRLVADTLEREWNDKLRLLADLQEERECALREDRVALDDAIRDRLIAMTSS